MMRIRSFLASKFRNIILPACDFSVDLSGALLIQFTSLTFQQRSISSVVLKGELHKHDAWQMW